MVDQRRARELRWVFRPAGTRPLPIRALAGTPVHAAGPASTDGHVNVVLTDGTRLRVTPIEIVAE